MTLKKYDIVELFISDLAFGGAGISKFGDFVIFVPRTSPGDRISARITKIKRNFAEAELEKLITPSPQRITPRCKHFGVCGGCSLQFLKYEDQLKLKEKQVRDALEHIGGIKDPPMLEIRQSPSEWFYRNKMEFSFSERGLGLHHAGKYDEIFELEECYLQSQFSVAVVQWMAQWMREKKLTVHNPKSNKGLLKNLIIREARSSGEFMVNLVTSHEAFPLREEFGRDIVAAFPQITSLYHTEVKIQKGFRTVVTETLLAGKSTLCEIIRVPGIFRDGESLLSLIFDITPCAFFQTNTNGTEVLLSLLLALSRPRTDDIVFDLYCGTGIIGMFLAKLVRRVYGIELNESALESARGNARKNGLSNIEFLCGDVKKAIKKIPEKPTLIIVDPPRAGLTQETVENILDLAPAKLVYVSCNPTTLARDLKLLNAKYKLKAVQPLDLFPQTTHVETICQLVRCN